MRPADSESTDVAVVHNLEAQRFEANVDGQRAFVAYRLHNGTIVFTHTEVPPALQGRGVGGALARTALQYARAAGLDVVPECPFITSYIRYHRQHRPHVRASH